jgi:hypothetical protein
MLYLWRKLTKMERFIIFTLNTATNEVVVKQSFKVLADADAYFVKDTTFNTISDWVESYGHYGCNSSNFNYYDRPELIILLDIQFEFPENETNTYEAIEFHKFRNALINRTEESTVYHEFTSTLKSEIKEKFSNLGKILYYPGAFSDFGPMKFFFENSSIDTVIYTDYMITREILEERIQNFINDFNNRDSIIITPNVFNKNNWNEFWPEQTNKGINNAFGIEYNFLVNKDKKCRFIYLATEAIKTYSILLECNLVPAVIVLQDHGMGGNWTYFGGDSPLYRLAVNNLPKYIFLEPNSNTKPWKSYSKITEAFNLPGALHNNRRALYTRKLFIPRRIDERIIEWNEMQPIMNIDGEEVRINQWDLDGKKQGYWEAFNIEPFIVEEGYYINDVKRLEISDLDFLSALNKVNDRIKNLEDRISTNHWELQNCIVFNLGGKAIAQKMWQMHIPSVGETIGIEFFEEDLTIEYVRKFFPEDYKPKDKYVELQYPRSGHYLFTVEDVACFFTDGVELENDDGCTYYLELTPKLKK